MQIEKHPKIEDNVLLSCTGICKNFGGMAALKDLDFQVYSGEIFGIAGPNGAGKTTLFNVMSKILPLDHGRVWFDGVYLERLSAHEICRHGLTRTFQIPQIFSSLTVYRNVLVGNVFGNMKNEADEEKNIKEVLNFVGLWDKRNKIAEELSLYERKVLMIATALATKPKMLMLDEPVAGLSKNESNHEMELIKRINKNNVTLILIEHNMDVLMGVSDRVMILQHGKKICEGSPEIVCNDEAVIEAYLGEKYVR
jgi:ABC-type branched-subunit amino acid transport system ATPase component